MTRRNFLQAALAMPIGASFASYRVLAAPAQGLSKITSIQALQLKDGRTLIRIDTDAGLSGYGECNTAGPIARSVIAAYNGAGRLPHLALIGKDPLAIQVHFHNMFYAYPQRRREIKVLSGIDMALWDLAGKILNHPVSKLLGGNFREEILLYSHAPGGDYLSKEQWRDRAQRLKSDPRGFKAFKVDIHHALGINMQEYTPSIGPEEARRIYYWRAKHLATRSALTCTATANSTCPAPSRWPRRWSISILFSLKIRSHRNGRRVGWRCGARRESPS